jgi:hypothetical protein
MMRSPLSAGMRVTPFGENGFLDASVMRNGRAPLSGRLRSLFMLSPVWPETSISFKRDGMRFSMTMPVGPDTLADRAE